MQNPACQEELRAALQQVIRLERFWQPPLLRPGWRPRTWWP